jgi:DNA-binding IclR family transcriptional regulator
MAADRPTAAEARSGTQSVERAFAVLRAVAAEHRGGASVAVVMQAARLNRSTTYRMLKCLAEQGAIRLDERLSGYVLGPLALDLALAARDQLSIKELLATELARVAEKTGDTVFLLIRSEDDSVCIDRQLGSYPVKTLVVEIGTRRPLGVGAGAIAILGALTDEEARRVVLRNSARLAAFDTTPVAVLKAAAAARRLGHAVLAPHGVDGVTALAVPVFDPRGIPLAALAVAAINRRMGRQRQEQSLQVLRSAAQTCKEKLFLR